MTTALKQAAATIPSPRELSVETVLERAVDRLIAWRKPEGYWVGELRADVTLVCDCVLLYSYLEFDPIPRRDEYRTHILARQLPGGGWNIFPGGPPDINATLKAYTALKLLGTPVDAPALQRAREAIRNLGGLANIHSYNRFYLACLGQLPWSEAPQIPPELFFLPQWFPGNFFDFSSWSRVIIAPMMIMRSLRHVAPIPKERGIGELIDEFYAPKPRKGGIAEACFLGADRLLSLYARIPANPLRRFALRRVERWMRFLLTDGGLGAIIPAIQNSIMALKALGATRDDPIIRKQLEEIESLHLGEGDSIRVQPCFSPVWDTAWSIHALAEAGLEGDHPVLRKAESWLLDKHVAEVRTDGRHQPAGPGYGAWYFQYSNPAYPDIDDTATICMALNMTQAGDPRREEAIKNALRWIRAMVNSDGGWSSFDKNLDRDVLKHIPFADHNAMLDPSTVDITARVLECFARTGASIDRNSVSRAIRFIQQRQESNGSWFGRWGVNYIYGTSHALTALAHYRKDFPEVVPALERGAKWFDEHQNPDGGWGESALSYHSPEGFRPQESTPSQTAWALLGLLAAKNDISPAVERGVRFLTETQTEDGTWEETYFTGTGFPGIFYLGYSMYSHYFPMIALSRYIEKRG